MLRIFIVEYRIMSSFKYSVHAYRHRLLCFLRFDWQLAKLTLDFWQVRRNVSLLLLSLSVCHRVS